MCLLLRDVGQNKSTHTLHPSTCQKREKTQMRSKLRQQVESAKEYIENVYWPLWSRRCPHLLQPLRNMWNTLLCQLLPTFLRRNGMTWSSWPASPTTTPTPIQRKWRYVAIGKGGSHILLWPCIFLGGWRRCGQQRDPRGNWTAVVSILTSSVFYLFWQVEDLAQQAECPDIEVLLNVSEKEVKTQKTRKE